MPSRRREQMVLLVGLVVLNALLGWHLHRLWGNYQRRTSWILAPVAAGNVSGPVAPSRPRAGTRNFAGIVERNMFSPERTSQAPTEEVKMPQLPFLYGTMNVGEGWFALMASGDQASGLSKRIRPGDEIGGFKLVSISGSRVVVEWGGKKFDIDASDSARRPPQATISASAAQGPVNPRGASTAPSANPGRVTMVESTRSASTSSSPIQAEKKKLSPAGYNAPPGAPIDAPAGTVFGGKRKVVNPTPFGEQVFWLDVESGQKSTEGQAKEK